MVRALLFGLMLLGLCATGFGQNLQVWTPDHWEVLEADARPGSGEAHVRMAGGRNGMASGVIAARGQGTFRNPRVQVSDLRHENGQAVLPASAIVVRYASQGHRDAIGDQNPSQEGPFFHLSTASLGHARLLVARLTANIPADAEPGVYRGRAVVQAGGAQNVPITLTVGRGTLPPPTEYASHVNFLHSPDSVALRYRVPMWSADHWRKLESSFAVFQALGQSVLHVPVIVHSQTADGARSNTNHFGSREGLIRFRQQGQRFEPDFTVFDQFLERWNQQVGRPQFVVLYLWDISFSNHERDDEDGTLRAVVTGVDARGRTGQLMVPYPGTEGSDELWKAVIDGARERVQRLGWDSRSLIIGIAHDRKPTDRTVAFFNRIAPDIQWNVISHMRGYGIRDGRMNIGEMSVAYHEFPWNPRPNQNFSRGSLLGGWNSDFPVATICRFHASGSETGLTHRWLGCGNTGAHGTRNRTNIIGPSRWKVEFWPVPITDERGRTEMRSIFNMSGWVNLMRNHTNLGTAGPDGLEPSVYLQNNIESIQDTEARILIERILSDPERRARLPEDLIERAHDLIVARARFMHHNRSEDWTGMPGFDHHQHSIDLYNVLGDMQQHAGTPPPLR
ncbi:MAG: hypothetical protein JJU36_08045 [Phycisphaeraceae bacterium]|nr:hypothetical protein [Phycisphaeraceae bacterium]